jgi:uncharacterized protein YciI
MSNASPLCVAIMEPGPAWVGGRATREQPFWDEHAAFIDGLAAEGRVMLAGPFTDWTGALQILRGDAVTMQALLATDPWVVRGVFSTPRVRPWAIWVDGLAG